MPNNEIQTIAVELYRTKESGTTSLLTVTIERATLKVPEDIPETQLSVLLKTSASIAIQLREGNFLAKTMRGRFRQKDGGIIMHYGKSVKKDNHIKFRVHPDCFPSNENSTP